MLKFLASRNGLLLCAALILAGLLYRQLQPGPAPDAPVTVTTATATVQTLPNTLIVSGLITPVEQVALNVTQPGTLAHVFAKLGDHVTRGQILASLDDGELAANAAAAQAQARAAAASGAASARAFARAQSIRDSGAIAPELVDQRGAAAAAQTAQAGAARADAAAALSRLAAASVTAPWDGVIAAAAAEPGQYAAPGGPPLFTLIGDAGYNLVAAIPQDDIPQIRPGMTAILTLPTGEVTGIVTGADPRIDPTTHMGTLRVALPHSPGLIAGAFVQASVALAPASLVVVPETALVADETGFHVMVVTNGIAMSRPVTLAPSATATLASIAAGLAPGNVVVAQNGAALHDGQTVRLAP